MKTIATAALFLTLTASAWADEPQNMQNDEPMVLSDTEMDGVTAGTRTATPFNGSNILGVQPIEQKIICCFVPWPLQPDGTVKKA